MASSVFAQILLMILFGTVECRRRLDLSDNGTAEPAGPVEFGLLRFSGGLLFRRMIEHDRSILAADVRALSIKGCWVMVTPKDIEQLVVSHFVRVEFHLHHLGMTGGMTANVFVAWVFGRAAGVTARRRLHAFDVAKQFFDSPETTRSKCRLFDAHVLSMKREAGPCNQPSPD